MAQQSCNRILRGTGAILALALFGSFETSFARTDVCMPVPDRPCVPVPDSTPGPGPTPGGGNDCDWDCKQANREQTRNYRAWKANRKGKEAHDRGDFAKARGYYNDALHQIPGYSYSVSNLRLLDAHQRYYNFSWGREAVDRGDYDKARQFFRIAQTYQGTSSTDAEIQSWLRYIDYLSRFKFSGSMMVTGTGSQIAWNAPPGTYEEAGKQAASDMIRDELTLARRDMPAGVDTQIYNMGLGVAASTWPLADLFLRVLQDQWKPLPVPRSGQSPYNAIKGRRFELLGCHSNGAMTCLLALYNQDAVARDVVLYGPQITPDTARVWQQLLNRSEIRSLRIIMNTGDPIPSLAMIVNRSRSYGLGQRGLLFKGGELKSSLSQLIPSAQIDVQSCSFRPTAPFSCHYMTSYPQCRLGKPTRLVPGTKGFIDRSYTEPPAPGC